MILLPRSGKKSKINPLLGIVVAALLLFGTLSISLQYSNNVINNAYAQEVDLGPFVTIGPPNRSERLDPFSDGRIIYVAYEARGENNVYLGLVLPGPGGRGEELQDTPENVMPGGSDPSIVVALEQIYIVAERPGVGDIAFVECVGDDDFCEEPQSLTLEGEGSEDSCADGVDNDGDGDIDTDDADCLDEGGGLCSDGVDNDGDGVTDSADPDCDTGGDFVSFDGNGLTGRVGPAPYTSTSPQMIFVTTGGEDDFALLDQRNEERDSALNLAEQIQEGEQREDQRQSALNLDESIADQRGAIIDLDELPIGPEPPGPEPPGPEPPGPEPPGPGPGPEPPGPVLECPPPGTGGSSSSVPSNAEIATSSDGSDIYIVWQQDGDIMFRASHDGGENFGETLNLSDNAGTSFNPRVATSSNGQFVHVTWEDNTPGNLEIFYSRSTDGGETFNGGSPVGTPTNLSNTPRASFDHQLVAEGANVYVVWVDCTTDNGDIYFRESNNNGESFSDINNLSAGNRFFDTSRDPDMAAQGSLVSVVWTVYGGAAGGIGEILFRESTNNGNSFGAFVLVSNTPETDSKEPQVDYTPEDAERYVAWHDQGGPPRVNTPEGTYNVLAKASDNGVEFSPPVNLSDAPNNPDKQKQTSQLQIVDDVAVWDPSSRRG
jgi:hypothetical protein